MGLFEFHVWMKKILPESIYAPLKKIYRKTIKFPQERRFTKRRLKQNCDVWFIDKLLRKGTSFPHPYGIVISTGAHIGKNCIISQNVTLAGKGGSAPKIMDNVKIFANSVIIGGVTVGTGSIVGAGSVVTKDIPPKEVWAGNPAKFIRKISEEELNGK